MSFFKCLMFVTLVPILISCDNAEQKEAKYFERGDALFAEKDYVRARLEYKNAARISPTNPRAIYSLGVVDEAQGNIEAALRAFLVTEQQDSEYVPAKSKLVNYFMAAQQYDEVAKRIEPLLKADPDNATAYAIKASLLLRGKNYDQAKKLVQVALDKEPNNVIAYSVLTGIHNAQKAPKKALAAINEGIEKNQKELSLYLLKAALYSEQGNISEVSKTYNKIFKIYPEELRLRFDLAEILSITGNNAEAEKTLRNTVNDFPDNLNAKHKLAVFLEENQNVTAAEKAMRNYIEKEPKEKAPYIWLADLYIRHKQDLLAVETLKNLINNNADDKISLTASTSLAGIKMRKGDIVIAQRLIDSVLAKDVNNEEALFVRANLSFFLGDHKRAVSDLRTIIKSNPKAAKASRVLGEILILQGRIDLAVDTLVVSTRSTPTDFATQVRLAQLYSLQGNIDPAMKLLSMVTKADPSYSVGWENIARLNIEGSNWVEAEKAINKLEALDGQKMLAKFLQAQMKYKTGKHLDARKLYNEIIKADPDSPLSEHALSALLTLSQEKNKLQQTKYFLSSLQTSNPTVSTVLGGVLVALNEKGEAEEAFKNAIAQKPKTQIAYFTYAQLLIERDEGEAALIVLEQAEKAVPHEIAASMKKASYLSSIGRFEEAISIYDKVLSNNNKVDVAANNMAQLIADYKSYDKDAMEKARIAAERFANSNNSVYLDTLGWVYFRQGLMPQAQNYLKKAVSLAPTPIDPQIQYHYGALLAELGRADEAKDYLLHAVVAEEAYSGSDDAKKLLDSLF